MEMDGNKIAWISKEELVTSTEIYSNKIVCHGREMSMMPSASACVAMFKEYVSNSDLEREKITVQCLQSDYN